MSLVHRCVQVFRQSAHVASEGAALPSVVTGVDWSDHRSFWDVGVPALEVTTTAPFRNAEYHQSGDTVDRVDFDRLALTISALVPVVDDLAGAR